MRFFFNAPEFLSEKQMMLLNRVKYICEGMYLKPLYGYETDFCLLVKEANLCIWLSHTMRAYFSRNDEQECSKIN